MLTMRSFVGDGPIIGLPAFQRVLVLGAHPDDESLGCGGTIALLRDAGADIHLVVASNGEATKGSVKSPDETARLRREEVAAAAAHFGASLQLLGLPDGALGGCVEELAHELRDIIDSRRPDVVFTPWLLDGHPDHQAAARALAAALSSSESRPEVWGFETWTALIPNRIVDITRTMPDKRHALELHRTAALAFDLRASEGLNRWRSVHGLMGRGYAEAFLAMDAPNYVAFAAEAEGLAQTSPA